MKTLSLFSQLKHTQKIVGLLHSPAADHYSMHGFNIEEGLDVKIHLTWLILGFAG